MKYQVALDNTHSLLGTVFIATIYSKKYFSVSYLGYPAYQDIVFFKYLLLSF